DMGDGMADDMGDGMADDMGDGMADDMGDDEMLADTGANTPLLAIVAFAVVLAGAMLFGLSRRLRTL
ncbi:MAG: LPXTG cell wall anchor domain-containing protein, partial [bacterium]|nr:LPXTG cell wall anchor domain-containing protein [bacterium]